MKRFIAISIILHALILAGIAMLPEEQKQKSKEFFAKLVTPEEAQQPPPPVVPVIPQKPLPRPQPKRPPSRPVPQRVVPVPPRMEPTPERPVVPGMGKEGSKPLPEGLTPKGAGRSDEGEGKGAGTVRKSLPSDTKPGYLDREKLFDPGVIAETANKDKEGKGGGKKSDAITFDTKEYRYAGYMRKLREKIESIWQYPPEALRRGLYGDLKIRFVINKNGTLRSVELERTSGYKMLDDAALKALKEGEPYWPLPDEWGMETYTVQGHFIYTLYGYGLR